MNTQINKDSEGTSKEDSFFGVTTVIDDMLPKTEKDEKEELIIETAGEEDDADDKSVKSVKPVQPDSDDDEPDVDDPELGRYSAKVQKRINKLTYAARQAEREREEAHRLQEEAVRVANTLVKRNREYERVISQGEGRLVEQMQQRAQLALAEAKREHQQAYEAGDTEAISTALEKFFNAQAEARSAAAYQQEYQQRVAQWTQAQQAQQAQQRLAQQAYVNQRPQVTAPPKPSHESLSWAEQNPWFGDDKHRDMTAIAYATHETLIRDRGIKPDSEEYYREINAEVRRRFPEYFERAEGRQSPNQRPNTVVAPAARNNGAKSRKVTLTPTQISLAKKLGLTLEQYAEQLR